MKQTPKNIKLLRSHLDRKFDILRQVREKMPIYTGQWIRIIRQALGMSQVQLAKRLKMTPQAVYAIEKSELRESITITTLKKIANSLGCSLYVVFIPGDPLEKMVQIRAMKVAQKLVEQTVHTMGLEKQAPSKKFIEQQIEEIASELVRNNDKRIWEES